MSAIFVLWAMLVGAAILAAGSARGDEQDAVRDVEARLASLALPPGAESVAAKPAGITAQLNGPPEMPGSPNLVDRAGWWVAPGTPERALAWFHANLPEGGVAKVEGASTRLGVVEYRSLTIALPALPKVDERAILVTAAARPEGGTALRIDSQAVWVEPHPASERIPVSSRFLEVTWHRPNGRDSTVATFNARFVRSIATALDALPIVQPGIYHCPMERPDPPTVTLRFRARRGASLLAAATQGLPGGGPCDAMALTIRGKREPGLEGTGPLVARLRKLR